MLTQALRAMLQELGLDSTLYSLHSLMIGGATAAYRAGDELMQITWHGLWSLNSFGDYVISVCVQMSPVASAFAGCLAAT